MHIGGNWKALYGAACAADLEQLNYWLTQDIDLDYQHNEVGTTILIAAAERGHRVVCELLVARGASIDVVSHWDGHTAQAAAQSAGHTALARWFAAQPRKS